MLARLADQQARPAAPLPHAKRHLLQRIGRSPLLVRRLTSTMHTHPSPRKDSTDATFVSQRASSSRSYGM